MLNEQESNKEVINHLSGSGDVKPKTSVDLDNEKTSMEELRAEMGTKKEAISVHSMPGKFVAAARTSELASTSAKRGGTNKGNNSKKLLLISTILILIVIAVIAGVLFFVGKNVPEANTNQVVNQNDNQNQNQNTNENTNDNSNNQQVLDADNDGLSYEEELIFSTNQNLEDTDRDGYKDGQEIASLYNPLLPAQSLADSGLVTRFINDSYAYNILRPKTWLVKTLADLLDNVLVLPDSESGVSFSILVEDNSAGQTLNQALASRAAELGSAANYQNYSLAGAPALRSKDGRNVISIHGKYIYVISHSVSPSGEVNFNNIFEMMLSSFTWKN